jgi:hypothetical protein
MTRFRLSFIFAAALLATVWGAGDARVPASLRRLRGQPGRVLADADAGAPDALRTYACSSHDPERLDSRRPAALPAVTLALPVISPARREEHRAAARGATPRLTLPHASRAPPHLA